MRGHTIGRCLTAAVILICGVALAQSEPPAPGPGKSSGHQQTQTGSAHQNSEAKERGTKSIPLVVELAPSEETKAKAEQDAEERNAKAASDWWLIGHTGVLAIATIALVVVTGGLVWFAWKQASDMKDSISHAETSAKAAIRSADITQLALEAAETPYLVPSVRAFDVKVDRAPPSGEGLVSLIFENCGRSPATVLELYYDLFGSSITPDAIKFPPPQINVGQSYILPPGQRSDQTRFTVGSFRDWNPSDQSKAAWMLGHVRYADVFGNQFLTGFCYYRTIHGAWKAQGSRGHNYRRKLSLEELLLADNRDQGQNWLSAMPNE